MAREPKKRKSIERITNKETVKALSTTEPKQKAAPQPVLAKKKELLDRIEKIRGKSNLKEVTQTALIKRQKDNLFVNINSYMKKYRLGVDEELRDLEYDFAEIGKIEDLESIVTRAFKRKKELALKQGFNIVGKNKKTTAFLKERITEIEDNSTDTFNDIIKQVTSDLVSRHNAFIWKKRGKTINKQSSKFKFKAKEYDPIESLVVIPPESVQYIWDTKLLKVKRWYINGYDTEVDLNDMVHLTMDKKTGFVAGTPSIVAVLQDILSLRRTEQDIEILVHLFVFPIIVYKLAEIEGDDASAVDFDLQSALDKAAVVLNGMMNNGGAVLPPGDTISNVQSNATIDYRTFLSHIKSRVYTGLGVSDVDMGEGSSSNRATAETLSGIIIDSVKAIQQTVSDKITNELFKDIIRENRSVTLITEDNMVKIHFNEIDLYYLIKYENHNSVMFSQNVITHTEARNRIGLDPVSEKDKSMLFSNMFAEVNAGAGNLAASGTSPSNQHTEPSDNYNRVKQLCLASYMMHKDNGEVNIQHYNRLFDEYYAKHFKTGCDASVMNVRITVAKAYFSKLSQEENSNNS